MPTPVTIIITSDRYGGAGSDFSLEKEVIAAYPDLDVDLRGASPQSTADMIALGAEADALLFSTRNPVDEELVSSIPRVKVIGRYGVGLDNVDLDAAARHGKIVTHYPQYCTAEVADHALSLILALNRRIVELDRDLREGVWETQRAATTQILRGPLPPLRESTVGIIGFGRIGQAVATRLRGFGPRILAADPYVDAGTFEAAGVTGVSLDEVLAQSDIVTIHCPLTPQTRGFIGASELARMKPTAAIVNTARGPIIAEQALIAHLQANPGFRAALDVMEVEPLPRESPLFQLPNVILTPHSAYYSERSTDTVQRETLASVLDALSGIRPITVANPAVLEKVPLAENPRAAAVS